MCTYMVRTYICPLINTPPTPEAVIISQPTFRFLGVIFDGDHGFEQATVCERRGRSTPHRGAAEHRRRRVSRLLSQRRLLRHRTLRCLPLSLGPWAYGAYRSLYRSVGRGESFANRTLTAVGPQPVFTSFYNGSSRRHVTPACAAPTAVALRSE